MKLPNLDEQERRIPKKPKPREKGPSVPDHCRVPGLRWQAPRMSAAAVVAALKPKRSKYNARRTEYNGRTYDSAAEAAYAAELDLKKKAGLIREWIPQVRVPLEVNGIKICTMVMDFQVFYPVASGLQSQVEYIEVKGFETPVYKLKRKLFEAIYQNVRFTVIHK